MKALAHAVLRTLADGEFHSGATLAAAAGMSRASVWHAIRELETGGLTIYKVRSRGYRLSAPVDVLDGDRIRDRLGALASRFQLDVRGAVASTSTALLEAAAHGAPTGRVIVAELQTAGRGRLGRPWLSGIGASLTFSLLWRFERGAGWLGGLSLAVGIAVARVLRREGARDVGLKWPNDVLWHGCKLAGILIELHGEAMGPSAAVIGIGLNIRLPEHLRDGAARRTRGGARRLRRRRTRPAARGVAGLRSQRRPRSAAAARGRQHRVGYCAGHCRGRCAAAGDARRRAALPQR
jgi:BirA family biotin operon repressor/biotin-[acetyl-CoA-carboxylase] ligase